MNAARAPASRTLAAFAVALALLAQALFAVPMALRMAADAAQALPFGAALCSHADDGGAAVGYASDDGLPAPVPHHHAQCPLCAAHAAPLVLLGFLFCALLPFVRLGAVRLDAAPERARPGGRYRAYLSRAPPLLA
ncbi:MAG: DUF2946 family protein [Proteobacteria bacterium]|nr:DUF2946 family protein [Pseudomonadota bacterium]